MADLQIAGRREQPLQRDLLVAQRREVGRERRSRFAASASAISSQRSAPTGSMYHGSTGLRVRASARREWRREAHRPTRDRASHPARARRPSRTPAPSCHREPRGSRPRRFAARRASARRRAAPTPDRGRQRAPRPDPDPRTAVSRPRCRPASRVARPLPARHARPAREARRPRRIRTTPRSGRRVALSTADVSARAIDEVERRADDRLGVDAEVRIEILDVARTGRSRGRRGSRSARSARPRGTRACADARRARRRSGRAARAGKSTSRIASSPVAEPLPRLQRAEDEVGRGQADDVDGETRRRRAPPPRRAPRAGRAHADEATSGGRSASRRR